MKRRYIDRRVYDHTNNRLLAALDVEIEKLAEQVEAKQAYTRNGKTSYLTVATPVEMRRDLMTLERKYRILFQLLNYDWLSLRYADADIHHARLKGIDSKQFDRAIFQYMLIAEGYKQHYHMKLYPAVRRFGPPN